MGDRGFGGGTRSSDGVVAYNSSHLDGAESEKIVPAGHVVFSNEAAVLEIKRILEENLARVSEKRTGRGLQNTAFCGTNCGHRKYSLHANAYNRTKAGMELRIGDNPVRKRPSGRSVEIALFNAKNMHDDHQSEAQPTAQ